jgi:hypothetical protein
VSRHAKAALAGLLVSIPWGWLRDIPNGEYAWFIGRILVVPVIAYALSVAATHMQTRVRRNQ